jgi:uncharacterized protein YqeY
MTLKEKINADYIAAFKAKDTIGKSALSGLKSKILEAEKAGPAGTELSDADVLKIKEANKQMEKPKGGCC